MTWGLCSGLYRLFTAVQLVGAGGQAAPRSLTCVG